MFTFQMFYNDDTKNMCDFIYPPTTLKRWGNVLCLYSLTPFKTVSKSFSHLIATKSSHKSNNE